MVHINQSSIIALHAVCSTWETWRPGTWLASRLSRHLPPLFIIPSMISHQIPSGVPGKILSNSSLQFFVTDDGDSIIV